MRTFNLKLANSIGLINSDNLANQNFAKIISDLHQKKNESAKFENLATSKLKYKASNGVKIDGYDNLLQFIKNPANSSLQVFPEYIKKCDLALEGGGTFGFAHVGAVHAYALKCIGADRFSGTSAGAIVAALMAGGYEVDLNYQINTLKKGGKLAPSKKNSLNQIVFESDFSGFEDINLSDADIKELIENSFFSKVLRIIIRAIIDECVSKHFRELVINIEGLKKDINKKIADVLNAFPGLDWDPNSFDSDKRTIRQALKQTIKDAVDEILNNFKGGFKALEDLQTAIFRNVGEIIISLIEVQIQMLLFGANLLSSGEANKNALSFLSLVERGGLWEGTVVRDWIEFHLQAKAKKTGSGVLLNGEELGGIMRPKIRKGNSFAKAILFEDLDYDLCITATSVGNLNEDYSITKDGLIYFSKKTSPKYPVAEAVRRSLSLPFVFIPRKLNDGYTNGAKVYKTSDFDQNYKKVEGGIYIGDTVRLENFEIYPTRWVDTLAGPIRTIRPPQTPTTTANPHLYGEVSQKALCQDGGFFVNVPISVFRDPLEEVFTCERDSNHNFTKTLIVSNLNQGAVIDRRPFDIPAPKSKFDIIQILSTLVALAGNVTTASGKLELQFRNFLNSTALGEWKEFDINLLMALVPNTIVAESRLLDPIAGDTRLSGLSFDMATTTKKWMLKCGFDAGKDSLTEMSNRISNLKTIFEIGDSTDPYLHILNLTNLAIAGSTSTSSATVVPGAYDLQLLILSDGGESPLKEGDGVFIGNPTPTIKIVNSLSPMPFVLGESRLGTGLTVGPNFRTYKGAGYSIIKVEKNNTNIRSVAQKWLSFKSNIDVQVTLLLDRAPTNLNGYENEPTFQPALEGLGAGSRRTRLFAFSKLHSAGVITIPGARNFLATNSSIPLIVLVRPV